MTLKREIKRKRDGREKLLRGRKARHQERQRETETERQGEKEGA